MAKNQRELARVLGLTEGQVSKLRRKGMPVHDVEAARAWRARHVAPYLRSGAAAAPAPVDPESPWTAPGVGQLDLTAERAGLARAQRLAVEAKNARESGLFAPISLLARVLATASQAVAERFEHLPGHLRKTCPEMTDRQRDEVVAVIAAARNEWIRSTAELVAADLASPDDGPDIDDDLVTPANVESAP